MTGEKDSAREEDEFALSLLDSVGYEAAEVAGENAELAFDGLMANPARGGEGQV